MERKADSYLRDEDEKDISTFRFEGIFGLLVSDKKEKTTCTFGELLRLIPQGNTHVSFDRLSNDYCKCLHDLFENDLDKRLNATTADIFYQLGKTANEKCEKGMTSTDGPQIFSKDKTVIKEGSMYVKMGPIRITSGHSWIRPKGYEMHQRIPLITIECLQSLSSLIVNRYIMMYNKSYEDSRRIFLTLLAAQCDTECSAPFGILPLELIAKISKYAHKEIIPCPTNGESYDIELDADEFTLWMTYEELLTKMGIGKCKLIFTMHDFRAVCGTYVNSGEWEITTSMTIGIPKTWSGYRTLCRLIEFPHEESKS